MIKRLVLVLVIAAAQLKDAGIGLFNGAKMLQEGAKPSQPLAYFVDTFGLRGLLDSLGQKATERREC